MPISINLQMFESSFRSIGAENSTYWIRKLISYLDIIIISHIDIDKGVKHDK